jgi:hypothetical protein
MCYVSICLLFGVTVYVTRPVLRARQEQKRTGGFAAFWIISLRATVSSIPRVADDLILLTHKVQ